MMTPFVTDARPSVRRQPLTGRRPALLAGAALLALICLAPPVLAADPTYSGDLLTRSTLTGDWGGVRNDLQKKGVTFDAYLTQVAQGVVGGGTDSSWKYGGHGVLTLTVDTGKLGLWPGGFLSAEMEGNYGHAVNGSTGALVAVNSNQMFPTVPFDELCLPQLSFTQFLSEYVGLFIGKLDTMTSADANEFAHGKDGKGGTQFMNLAFNVNQTAMLTVPYSTLGTGVIILPTRDPNAAVISLMVVDASGTANTTGFDTLNANRLSFAVEGRVRTGFFGLTGHQLLGLTYSNKNYTSLDQSLRLFIENDRQIQAKKGSWSLFYNFDQYLYEPEKGSGKGIGVFGRFGASDGNPNPVNYFFSFGVGGKGIVPSRPHDQFGIGWYYIDVASPNFTGPLATRTALRDEQGLELYYTAALTPWAQLTPDIQAIHGAQEQMLRGGKRQYVDTAVVLGLRLQLVF